MQSKDDEKLPWGLSYASGILEKVGFASNLTQPHQVILMPSRFNHLALKSQTASFLRIR